MTECRRIGIIGGGQLARMMQGAAIGLGLEVTLLAEAPGVSAALVIPNHVGGDYTDIETVLQFAHGCDAVTFDHEHVPATVLAALEGSGVAVRPGRSALLFAQDKAQMRRKMTALGAPVPAWSVVSSPEDLVAFGDETGWPVVAKISRGGYDGKGVWKLDSPRDASVPFAALRGPLGPTERSVADDETAPSDVVIIVEEFVPFVRELSVLVVRGPGGETVTYSVSETVQRDGICHETTTPAPGLAAEQSESLRTMGEQIASALDVVGVLTVELMQRADGSVVVNELAMRPHNTGHWTIDGAQTSQFENHLRAVAGLPLGPTGQRTPVCVMANVLGGACEDLFAGVARVLQTDPGVRVQMYGKGVRPGRKVGHVTVCGSDVDKVRTAARAASAVLEGRD